MKLQEIQQQLKAPKGQFNSFGKYNYRSCEDILEAVKPLLGESILTLCDDIVLIGQRYYVKATAVFTDGDFVKTVSAFAREAEDKKGMDDAQITGSASSYARKYCLAGLLLLDDTKDPDDEREGTSQGKKKTKAPEPTQTKEPPKSGVITDAQRIRLRALAGQYHLSNDRMKQIISACGYSSSTEIQTKHYQPICDFIEKTRDELIDENILQLLADIGVRENA